MKLKTRFTHTQKGAGLTEYGLLVGLIAVLAITAVSRLGETTRDTFATVDATLSNRLSLEATPSAPEEPTQSGNTPAPLTAGSVVYANIVDPGTGFIFDPGRNVPYADPTDFGYTPTGITALHFNGVSNNTYRGNHVLPIPSAGFTTPGTYTLTVDMGNYDNAAFQPVQSMGIRPSGGGSLFIADSQTTPTPGLGTTTPWSFVYTLTQNQIDNGMEFYFFVASGASSINGSLDNLEITYTP